MKVSDFQVNCGVRSVLARHWIDLHKVTFGSFRGTVRFSGEIRHLGGHGGAPLDAVKLERIETEIRAVRGVQRVYYDFSNWRRGELGVWTLIEKSVGGSAPAELDEKSKTLEMETARKSTTSSTDTRQSRKTTHGS